jgi:hypothetical protein
MTLRWEEPNPGSLYGLSGSVTVAMVGQRLQTGRWWWEISRVDTRHVVKGFGETKSRSASRRAAERAWRAWLTAARLEPVR